MQDYISEYTFGESLNSIEDEHSPVARSIHVALAGTAQRLLAGGSLGSALGYIPLPRAYKAACEFVDGFIGDAVNKAYNANGASKTEKRKGPSSDAVVEEYVEHGTFAQEMAKKSPDREYLKSVLKVVFVAGSDVWLSSSFGRYFGI